MIIITLIRMSNHWKITTVLGLLFILLWSLLSLSLLWHHVLLSASYFYMKYIYTCTHTMFNREIVSLRVPQVCLQVLEEIVLSLAVLHSIHWRLRLWWRLKSQFARGRPSGSQAELQHTLQNHINYLDMVIYRCSLRLPDAIDRTHENCPAAKFQLAVVQLPAKSAPNMKHLVILSRTDNSWVRAKLANFQPWVPSSPGSIEQHVQRQEQTASFQAGAAGTYQDLPKLWLRWDLGSDVVHLRCGKSPVIEVKLGVGYEQMDLPFIILISIDFWKFKQAGYCLGFPGS